MLRLDSEKIYKYAIEENMPNEAVKKALMEKSFNNEGKIILVSIGKAGWEMARAAYEILGERISCGAVITKYGHTPNEYKMQNVKCEIENVSDALVGCLGNVEIYEAGHPVVDENGVLATKRVLELTSDLTDKDTVLFLVSGGGSALFESVDCHLEKMQELTTALLKCGANINEINAIRKHISNVKGGKLAHHVFPAKVFSVVLSDVVGNDLSTIASGPTTADNTTVENCLEILNKYSLAVDDEVVRLIKRETPKVIENATHSISGSVTMLCKSAMKMSVELGYEAVIVDDSVTCDAEILSQRMSQFIKENENTKYPRAFIFGGEVTIKVKGNGKGGRNQELALMCAELIEGKDNMCVFCVGSDGTDGPTDAAGGFVDGKTCENILKSGKSSKEYLKNNDSYNALKLSDGLIFTGPTGTNVNDLYVILIEPKA